MDRRNFVKAFTSSGLALTSGKLFAAGVNQPRLLVVFLRGGYDSASLLVPISSDFYYESRPHIAIAKSSGDVGAALPLNADWGLHPVLRESIYPLFESGQAAFIPFAGTADVSRSHFKTQDTIELGQPLDQSKNFRSGFLNRLASTLTGADPMSFTEQLPLVFAGHVQVANAGLRSVTKPSLDTRQSNIISSMYKSSALEVTVEEGFVVRDEVVREMAVEMEAANRNSISSRGFELQVKRMARLMKERYSLGFVDVGGWDTHVSQGNSSGYLANRFNELGNGLAAFSQEIGPMWRNTTVVVISEFGRTFRQNGSRGTDHGHGTTYWVLGGSVRGKKIAGEQIKIDQSTLFQNRDFQVLNDYRAVLAGLFSRQYGLNSSQNERVFAGVKPVDLGLL